MSKEIGSLFDGVAAAGNTVDSSFSWVFHPIVMNAAELELGPYKKLVMRPHTRRETTLKPKQSIVEYSALAVVFCTWNAVSGILKPKLTH